MRIAYVVTYFPALTETFIIRELLEFHRGGAEIRVYHLTKFREREVVHEFARPALRWARSGPELYGKPAFGAWFRAIVRKPSAIFKMISRICASYWREPLLLMKSLALVPKSLWAAEDISAWKTDHIHAGFAGHPATCAWIVHMMTGIPYSVSCHGHDIFRSQTLLDEKLSRAAFVRPISEYNKQFLIDRVPRLRDCPIEVIHCGVDTQHIEAFPSTDSRTFQILFVGSLQARKGVDVLLRALARSPDLGDWTCNIVGDGPDRRKLEQLTGQLGLAGKVEFRGGLPYEAVVQACRRAHVLVVPSVFGPGGRAEGIPTVIMEALAHCRPVIASELTGIPELVRDGETGYLFPPGDSAALARALKRVRDDPETATALAERGRELVIAEFDLPKNVAYQYVLFQLHSANKPAGTP